MIFMSLETRVSLAVTQILMECSNAATTMDVSMPVAAERAFDDLMLPGDQEDRAALRRGVGRHLSVPPKPIHTVTITLP